MRLPRKDRNYHFGNRVKREEEGDFLIDLIALREKPIKLIDS